MTEQDIAKFQEAFFTRPGDGTLTVERVKAIFASLDLQVSDKEVQVGSFEFLDSPCLDSCEEVDIEGHIRIHRSLERNCVEICCKCFFGVPQPTIQHPHSSLWTTMRSFG